MHPGNATRQALFALGFLSIGTQLYVVREAMMVFSGNELVIGMVLASWMVLTGAGSLLGRFGPGPGDHPGRLVPLLLLVGLLPIVMVAGLDVLKAVLVPYGVLPGPGQVMAACAPVQLPFCLLNGYLFTVLSSSSAGRSPAESYAWESLGSMVSGALVNFVLLWISGPFVGLMILSGVFFAFLAWFSFATTGIKMTVAVILVSLAWLAVTGTTDLRAMTERFLYPGQHVVSDSETPYGQVVVTRNAGQFNFYGNGMLMCSTGNGIGNEENVHYALLQRPAPRSILLISGGFTGTLAEILKYRPSRVDYVELNPSLVAIAARYTRQLNDPAIAVHETDARRFIRATSARYDVILINVPAPSSLQVNRYYTLEFLAEARHHMNPGAVISFSLPSGGDYVSRQAGLLNSVLWNTLKTYFKNVLVVPGGRNYFLASDAPLSIDIPSLVRERGIETDYVNGFYLDAEQLRERSAGITPKDSPGLAEPEVNRDFHPVAAWYHVSWWMSLFNLKPLAVLLFFLAVMVFMAVTLNPMSTGLFTAGFTLASTEMILVFALQVLCGYLFQAVGALIMVFMLGLAAGSGMSPGKKTGNSLGSYRLLQVLTGLLALAVPLILHGLSLAGTGDIPVMAVIAVLAFSMAFITGREYTLATLLSGKTVTKTVASTYSAELFGSAAGAFAVALFLIPAIGIIRTGVLLALLNFISAGSLYFLKSKN